MAKRAASQRAFRRTKLQRPPTNLEWVRHGSTLWSMVVRGCNSAERVGKGHAEASCRVAVPVLSAARALLPSLAVNVICQRG